MEMTTGFTGGPGMLRGRPLSWKRLAVALIMIPALALVAWPASAQQGPCPNPGDPCAGYQPDVDPGVFPRITWIPTEGTLTTDMPARARANRAPLPKCFCG